MQPSSKHLLGLLGILAATACSAPVDSSTGSSEGAIGAAEKNDEDAARDAYKTRIFEGFDSTLAGYFVRQEHSDPNVWIAEWSYDETEFTVTETLTSTGGTIVLTATRDNQGNPANISLTRESSVEEFKAKSVHGRYAAGLLDRFKYDSNLEGLLNGVADVFSDEDYARACASLSPQYFKGADVKPHRWRTVFGQAAVCEVNGATGVFGIVDPRSHFGAWITLSTDGSAVESVSGATASDVKKPPFGATGER